MQSIAGECGGGGGDAVRTPQSTQSVPCASFRNSEQGLPSSQSELEVNSKTVSGSPSSHKPSVAYLHVSLHCASVALNIRAKKMAVAIRGEERGHVD